MVISERAEAARQCAKMNHLYLGINSQFYGYKESFDKERCPFLINDFSKKSLLYQQLYIISKQPETDLVNAFSFGL